MAISEIPDRGTLLLLSHNANLLLCTMRSLLLHLHRGLRLATQRIADRHLNHDLRLPERMLQV